MREAKRALLDTFYTQVGKQEGKALEKLLDEDPALMARRLAAGNRLDLLRTARAEIDAVAWAK